MQRRQFSREFKLEVVKLVKERGVAATQAARDLDVHENVLRKWVKDFATDPKQAFPGQGQKKPEQVEVERLRREVAKLKGARYIKRAATYFAKESMGSSASSQNIKGYDRRLGFAGRSGSRAAASTPG